ncbi:MAG: hypothetical protein JO020_15125 [Chloroflexi bacterium]|nr:hypothetical protein [Chloroflexota bacterium]MBV9895494.1 hypothetical protein [Chloroflexota bacterium]
MVRTIARLAALSLLVVCAACGTNTGSAAVGRQQVLPSPSPSAQAAASPTTIRQMGPAFVLLRSTQITTGARMNFQAQGFSAGEPATVTIENAQGDVEATLDPVTMTKDGNLDEVSVTVPGGLTPGEYLLHVVGDASGRSARTRFDLRQITPAISMDSYSAKSDHTFAFSGSGFAPNELVDVRLGGLGGDALASFQSDDQGNVTADSVPLPLVQPGDYVLYFVGERSQLPVAIPFNIQGFSPWVVLDGYAVPPYSAMGFTGQDFVPGDQIEVYLNAKRGDPLFRAQADANGQFVVKNAFTLPDSAHGDQTLIFVPHQSGAEISAKFVVLPFNPGLQLTNYAGRPGTPIAFTGDGWARNETLSVYVGESEKQLVTKLVTTFQADTSGAFTAAGGFRLPVDTVAGGVPITVRGATSQAEVTLWFQALELKATAELTAYHGPPGTVVEFTGRSFAAGEPVSVHLRDRGGPVLATGSADDDGTILNFGAYPIDGNWGDDIHFVLVGSDSKVEAATDFKVTTQLDTPVPTVVLTETPVATPVTYGPGDGVGD